MITTPKKYYIPIRATVHTHNARVQEGGDGMSVMILSDGDNNLAAKYLKIKHCVIDCGVLGLFSDSNNYYSIVSPDDIGITCSKIQ